MKTKNQNMFFYGMLANGITFIGAIVITLGLLGLFLAPAWQGITAIVLGLAIGIKGKAMRFDFRRQSGHILYEGGSW